MATILVILPENQLTKFREIQTVLRQTAHLQSYNSPPEKKLLPQLCPGSILLPPVNGVDGAGCELNQCDTIKACIIWD